MPANQGDKSHRKDAGTAGSCVGHPCSPAPILTADQAGTATDTLTDLVMWKEAPRALGQACGPARGVGLSGAAEGQGRPEAVA